MPLDNSFWDSEVSESAPQPQPQTTFPQTTFRGNVYLAFVQNNKEGHPNLYARSGKRVDMKRWFDEGCEMYVVIRYITDEDGNPKKGERRSRGVSALDWVPGRPGVLKMTRRGMEHWYIIEDADE